MRVAVLIKQVPKFEAMSLGSDGRLIRAGLELEVNPYCRRAISKGVELAREHDGECTVMTLGPPSADDALREAIAWGADRGIHICDPAFAGSDTLASARALAAAVAREGPFDLVLVGRNSVDADTGQVGPELAELLGLPFAGGVKALALQDGTVHATLEHDDGWAEVELDLPAVLSCAERLCEPAKVDPDGRRAVDAERITMLRAAELGAGPWGEHASGTVVGDVRHLSVERTRQILSGSPADQAAAAVALLMDTGALEPSTDGGARRANMTPDGWTRGPGAVVVLTEPDRRAMTRELLGAAARLAEQLGLHVVALGPQGACAAADAGAFGADRMVVLNGAAEVDDAARAAAAWCASQAPWAVLAPGTMWGREISARVAAQLGAGLTGDAVDVTVEADRLVAWKPAFGGFLVAAIHATTPTQMATIRPGVLLASEPRPARPIPVEHVSSTPARRVRTLASGRDDDVDTLATAEVVVGVGVGVSPSEYPALEPLLEELGATLAASRKVTDKGWQPRARQVGITGRSIAPRLYVAIGVSGKFNHMVGVRGAGKVLAINQDAQAPIFENADIGIVADWHEVVPLLVVGLGRRRAVVG